MNRGGQSVHGGHKDDGGTYGKLGGDDLTRGEQVQGPSGQETALDKDVMLQENSNVQPSQELSMGALTLSGLTLPNRPGYGNEGRKIVLKTNSFRMTINPSKKIFRYEVKIDAENPKKNRQGEDKEPRTLGRRVRQNAFALLFETPDFRSMGGGVATDFAKTLITASKLDLGGSGSKVYRIVYREAEETEPRANPTIYKFTVLSEAVIPISDYVSYLASRASDHGDFEGQDVVQALNIIMARTPNHSPDIFQAGQNKFFCYPGHQSQYIDLGGALIAVRGYYSSVRTSTMRTLLNVNAQCSPFYPAINMYDLMERHSKWEERSWEALEAFIEKLRVKTQYLKDKDGKTEVRVKPVVGLSHKIEERVSPTTGKPQKYGNAKGDHGNSRQLAFQCSEFPDDGPITVEKYFYKKHGITLKKPQAWALNCGTSKDPIWLPPELAEVMPGQPYRGRLSESQTANMLTVAARPPAENARRIIGAGRKVIGFDRENPTLAAFGVSVGKDMILVAGRILEPPPVLYKSKASATTTGASWNMMNKHFAVAGQVSNWSFLTLGKTTFHPNYLHQFRKALKDAGVREERLISPQGSSEPGFHADLPGNEEQKDVCIMNVFKSMKQSGVQFLLVILPDTSAVTYSRVKFWADVKAGIHTVCAVEKKLSKGPQYYANIALKFNLKCGGINHLLPEKKLGFLAQKPTMVVGIDVTHPAPKSMKETPSIAAVVASVDRLYGQFPGSIRCQASRQEMVQDLALMMAERLEFWRRKNGRLPERLLIYRDGVSEGQYKIVLDDELSQIRKACEIYGSSPQPKITIVVVGKRHHTRFYPTKKDDADMSKMGRGNPKSGTVVDRGVTMERWFDFFLQAHACLTGTAKPAHYVVILDEMKLGADEIQGITHHLCYLYGRATKAVSICPPAYYADILCERGRCYLQKYLNAKWPPGKEFDPNEAPWYNDGVAARQVDIR